MYHLKQYKEFTGELYWETKSTNLHDMLDIIFTTPESDHLLYDLTVIYE